MSVNLAKYCSTKFPHEVLIGVKCRKMRFFRSIQFSTFTCLWVVLVGRVVVENSAYASPLGFVVKGQKLFQVSVTRALTLMLEIGLDINRRV